MSKSTDSKPTDFVQRNGPVHTSPSRAPLVVSVVAVMVSVVGLVLQHRSENESAGIHAESEESRAELAKKIARLDREIGDRHIKELQHQWAKGLLVSAFGHPGGHDIVNRGNELLAKDPPSITNPYYQYFITSALAAEEAWRTGDHRLQEQSLLLIGMFSEYRRRMPADVDGHLRTIRLADDLRNRWYANCDT